MKNSIDHFWNASLEEIMQGYVYHDSSRKYSCLICGDTFEKGIIYPMDGILYEAEKAAQKHITIKHSSMFQYLVNMDKKYTGLTERQKEILDYFYQGYNDKEIVNKLGGGSTSTIRSYRFALREREKQAKIFLAIMSLLSKKEIGRDEFIPIHRGAKMVDERYAITEEERQRILKTYFKDGEEGHLSQFPSKEKRKIIILQHIIKKFDINKKYTEKEVNDQLKKIYDDYVMLRRYLIEYGFMDRSKDCSYYWVKE